MKRKIGDKVKIREDLVAGMDYGGCMFHGDMRLYTGEEATIIANNYDYYDLDIDDIGSYCWNDEMLEDICQPKTIEESNIEYLLKQLLDEDLLTLKGRELVKDYFNN